MTMSVDRDDEDVCADGVDRSGDQVSAGPSVTVAVVKIVVGLVVMVAGLVLTQQFPTRPDQAGYIPVMLVFFLIMMIGGGLVASGWMVVYGQIKGDGGRS